MAARGLETNKGTSEVSVGALSLYLANVMDPSVSYSSLEPQYSLVPPVFVDSGLISGETILRDELLAHDNSPRFLPKSKIQQSITYHGGTNELFGYLQHEELAGILAERIGSTTDTSGAPERVSFSNSSSWEQYGGRIKFMCSFGGKILPRPGDGKLRYAGGDTRIITIDRHTKYSNLMHKMQHLYGQPVLLKYQLPDEDLDALISVSCDEDVENMMEEYDRVHTIEWSSKLRIFLFSLSENDGHLTDVPDVRTTEEVYVDAINGMPETRTVGMVSNDSSNNLMGLEPIGTWNDHQPPINASTSLGIALQSKPVGMSQVNLQPLPRGFKTSPSNPSSPTITSRFSQLQQPAILDISHHMHPDQSVKGPPAHGVKHQLGAAYHDVSVKIGTSPLSSQHGAPIWPLELRNLADSPTKMQHENKANRFFQQEKDLISEPLVATGIPIGVMSCVNSCGKVLNVSCHSKLMIPEENIRGIAMPPHQQFSSQVYSHVVTSGHEFPIYNQLEVFPEWLHQKNSSMQTTFHSSDTGVALSSPRIVIPESSREMNAIQQHLPHQGDRNRWHLEQSHPNIVLQTQNELPLIGLKPLNTQIHLDEQLLSVEHATRQQHPIALMKVEKSHGNREGTCLEYYFPERLMQPQTPPYEGGSPCRESRSPFVDNKVIRVGGQGQMQHEDEPQYQEVLSPFVDIKLLGDENLQLQQEVVPQYQEVLSPFVDNKVIGDENGQINYEDGAAYSQYCEGVDWVMTKQNNEATSLVWNQNNQAGRSEESNRLVSLINADDINALHGSKSSFSYTTKIDAEQINAQVPLKISTLLTCVAENLPTLDGVKVLGSTQSPHTNETFPSPLSASAVENSNLLFAAKLEDGQWIKGTETGTQIKNSPGRNIFEDDPFSTDGLNRHPSSGKKYIQQESLDFYIDGTDTKVNKKQMIDSQIQPTTSISTPSQLSPRISADEVQLSSSIHFFAAEETISSNYLTEGLTCLNDEGFLLPVQNKDSGAWIVNSETVEFLNLRKEVSVTSNRMAGKEDLSLFNSGRVQENTNEENGDSVNGVPKSTDANVDPSLLFSLETISKQDWEKTITTIRSEEQQQTESLLDNKKTEVTVHSMVKKVSEIKVDDESVDSDVDKSITHLHPAAIAEAKAIGRGLQTIKNADLEELRELGTGTFGTVYHGKWRGTDVAIKRIKSSCFTGRPSERERLIADFWNEAYMLGQLHHPNVVAFYGVVSDGPDGTLATVTEFMVNGSLRQVLQKKDRTIDRRKRLLIIMDAAFGMEYLHGKNIIHFDLKCENMLVNMKDPQRPICKVGDLGLSKVKHQTMVSGGVRGTLPWMAPELLNGSSSLVSDKVDVFSFGIVMWELLTGEEPYADMHYGAIIGGIVSNTLRPAIPNWCDPAWKALMERCWATDPTERPSFVEISAELRAMTNFKS